MQLSRTFLYGCRPLKPNHVYSLFSLSFSFILSLYAFLVSSPYFLKHFIVVSKLCHVFSNIVSELCFIFFFFFNLASESCFIFYNRELQCKLFHEYLTIFSLFRFSFYNITKSITTQRINLIRHAYEKEEEEGEKAMYKLEENKIQILSQQCTSVHRTQGASHWSHVRSLPVSGSRKYGFEGWPMLRVTLQNLQNPIVKFNKYTSYGVRHIILKLRC